MHGQHLPGLGLHVADADFDRAVGVVRPHAPPDLGELLDAVGGKQQLEVAPLGGPVAEDVGDPAAREHTHERLRAGRVQVRPDAVDAGRVRRQREQVGQKAAHRVAHGDRPVDAAHADVDVLAPGVVAPRDVLELVFDGVVVRRVDDALVLPGREGVRAGRAERVPLVASVGEEGEAARDDVARRLAERLAARRRHLDLARDQLAEDVLAQLVGGAVAQQFEAVGKGEAARVEDLILLLEADREVGRGREAFLDLGEVGVGVGQHCRPSIPTPAIASEPCGARCAPTGGRRACLAQARRPPPLARRPRLAGRLRSPAFSRPRPAASWRRSRPR